jgi:hypothetical protein
MTVSTLRIAVLVTALVAGCGLNAAPASAGPATNEGAPQASLWAAWNALRGDAYELDAIERFREDGSKVACDRDGLVSYSGTGLRYHGAVLVSAPFRERLQRFEEVATQTATEIYGRAPRRLRHFGAFSCRASRKRSYRLSEHALGNAIDVAGFDFGPLPKGVVVDPELPKGLRGAFQVRVERHWEGAGSASAALHSRFLRELTARLIERRDIFRGYVGPSDPSHANHLHLDVAPWRYVRL